jgi:hypothetical protein
MSLIDTNEQNDPMVWLKRTYTEEHKKQMHRALAKYYVEEGIEAKKHHMVKIPIKKLLPYF